MESSDELLENADWLRAAAWDLWTPQNRLITQLDDLLVALHVDDGTFEEQRGEVNAFLKLPAAQAMPEGLRHQVDEFLAGRRGTS